MPSAFGFEPFPQRPSPDPQQVGAALAQSRFAGAQALAPAPAGPTPQLPAAIDPRDRLRTLFHALTVQSGREQGGPGQSGTGSAPPGDPNYPVDETAAHSALHASIGDAVQRLANGVMAAPDANAHRTARRRDRLLALGLSPLEADLLSRTGGT